MQKAELESASGVAIITPRQDIVIIRLLGQILLKANNDFIILMFCRLGQNVLTRILPQVEIQSSSATNTMQRRVTEVASN